MNVEVSQIPTIASEFITTVVMPKAPTGLLKFGIGFVSPYIRDAVAVRVEQSLPTLKMLGIVDEGKVDLDRASAAAYAALEEAGGKVELSGYMVDKADIDALLEIARDTRSTKEKVMDLKDMRKMQGERTEEELLEKIDKILDDARDGHYSLTSQNLEDLCEAWECIKHIRTVLAMDR